MYVYEEFEFGQQSLVLKQSR